MTGTELRRHVNSGQERDIVRMHGDRRVDILHRAVEAERPEASDEDLAPVGERNRARDLLYSRARYSSDEHRLLVHRDAKASTVAPTAPDGVPTNVVSCHGNIDTMGPVYNIQCH